VATNCHLSWLVPSLILTVSLAGLQAKGFLSFDINFSSTGFGIFFIGAIVSRLGFIKFSTADDIFVASRYADFRSFCESPTFGTFFGDELLPSICLGPRSFQSNGTPPKISLLIGTNLRFTTT